VISEQLNGESEIRDTSGCLLSTEIIIVFSHTICCRLCIEGLKQLTFLPLTARHSHLTRNEITAINSVH